MADDDVRALTDEELAAARAFLAQFPVSDLSRGLIATLDQARARIAELEAGLLASVEQTGAMERLVRAAQGALEWLHLDSACDCPECTTRRRVATELRDALAALSGTTTKEMP